MHETVKSQQKGVWAQWFEWAHTTGSMVWMSLYLGSTAVLKSDQTQNREIPDIMIQGKRISMCVNGRLKKKKVGWQPILKSGIYIIIHIETPGC